MSSQHQRLQLQQWQPGWRILNLLPGYNFHRYDLAGRVSTGNSKHIYNSKHIIDYTLIHESLIHESFIIDKISNFNLIRVFCYKQINQTCITVTGTNRDILFFIQGRTPTFERGENYKRNLPTLKRFTKRVTKLRDMKEMEKKCAEARENAPSCQPQTLELGKLHYCFLL